MEFPRRVTEPTQLTRTVCTYCAVGCGMLLETTAGRITAVHGDPTHPANFGMLCSKGRSLAQTVESTERATRPLLRANRHTPLQPATWNEALDESARQFARIIKTHGPDAVACYVSGQLLTEDYYVLNKLLKGFIGTNNIDSNSRLCMSSAVAGYKRAFGVDAPPSAYEDLDVADTIFIFGANPAFAHPILFRRIEAAKEKRPAMRIVVVDPRRTDSCGIADLHLAIRPGTDVALLLAMFNVLVWEGLIDRDWVDAHTQGFGEAVGPAREMTPRRAGEICGIDPADIVRAALWFGGGKSLSLWSMGFNQSTAGTDKNNALINLHLATGQVGRPGCGPFSLTGQPNAMGGREVGGLANLLPGHRDLGNPAHREEVARFWGGGPLAAEPGADAVEMFRALESGAIRAVWIICTNPMVSLPDSQQARRALEKAEWVMVSDIYHPTESSQYADVLFPAAGWGEKEGTMTNSERRVARVRKAVEPPGIARADWRVAADFAVRLGNELGHDWTAAFGYPDSESVFAEHRALLAGRDCDISGLSYPVLDAHGPLQWPVPAGTTQGTTRLYEDGRFPTPDGRARFLPIVYRPVARPLSGAYPLSLTTGRLRDQWHTRSRSGRVPALDLHEPIPCLDMHPEDARPRNMQTGDLAEVRSSLGATTVQLRVTTDIRPGVVFLPMHWGSLAARGGLTNILTHGDCDPVSHQPEFKHTPVEVRPASQLKRRVTVLIDGDERVFARKLIGYFPYAVIACPGLQRSITLIEAADDRTAPVGDLYARISEQFAHAHVLEYQDGRRADHRRLWVQDGNVKVLCWIGADYAGSAHLRAAYLKSAAVADHRSWLFGTGETAGAGGLGGAIVCSCMGVAEGTIGEAIREGALTLGDVTARCGAGSGCGSCKPALQRMLLMAKNERAA